MQIGDIITEGRIVAIYTHIPSFRVIGYQVWVEEEQRHKDVWVE